MATVPNLGQVSPKSNGDDRLPSVALKNFLFY